MSGILLPGRQRAREHEAVIETKDACKQASFGRLAQLGEHQLDKLGVTGSSPVPPTSQKPR